jgi:hypothetical protein
VQSDFFPFSLGWFLCLGEAICISQAGSESVRAKGGDDMAAEKRVLSRDFRCREMQAIGKRGKYVSANERR